MCVYHASNIPIYLHTHTHTPQVRDLVPESQAYMDLLAFERKLDATIARKRLEIQEMLRRPMKEKRKLRLFISHHFFTSEPESGVRADRSVCVYHCYLSPSLSHIHTLSLSLSLPLSYLLPSYSPFLSVCVVQEGPGISQWELKLEGVLLDVVYTKPTVYYVFCVTSVLGSGSIN